MSSSHDNQTGAPDDDDLRAYASPPCYQHELDPNYLGNAAADQEVPPGADSPWAVVCAWRARTRSRLLALRAGLSVDERTLRSEAVAENLRSTGILSHHRSIGFYWPMAGEIDLRPLLTSLVAQGIDAALPVIAKPHRPLEFWRWRPGDVLDESGPWGIPVPATRDLVEVTALLIPLVGFDEHGHRLGHGGGYYDRTLAALDPRPAAIGVGLEESRLRSIFPQAHDLPMDMIVTDAGAYVNEANVAKLPPPTNG